MRRRDGGGDKQFSCTFPGCDKAFYERKNMLQHQTIKHGRPRARAVGHRQWVYDEMAREWVLGTGGANQGSTGQNDNDPGNHGLLESFLSPDSRTEPGEISHDVSNDST